ncbi:MAG: hypothetical protein RBR42_00810 [Desulfomicrobium sp.]|nr:hypothetical protein [Desulfomicrobium sp.]
MSNPFISVLDLMDNDPSGISLKPIQDELLTMNTRIRKQMDAGLEPANMAKAQAVYSAIQAAQSILQKI